MKDPPTKKARKARNERPTGWDQIHPVSLSNGMVLQITTKELVPEEVAASASPEEVATSSSASWTGGFVWEAAEVLAKLLSNEPARVSGKRVLELGSGCGLLGIVAGALGAREVTLTDDVLFMASHNLDANFIEQSALHRRFRLQRLSWGNKEHIAMAQPPYDVILCSDLLYDSSHHEILANTLIDLSGPDTHILLATPDGLPRDKSIFCRRFYRILEEHGFEMLVISVDGPESQRAKICLDSGGRMDRGLISIVEMRLSDAPSSD